VVDELEPLIQAGGGLILDWHTCDAFPERWIDLVVVLQCNHTQLWDRLEARCVLISFYRWTDDSAYRLFSCRGYPLKKIQENNEAEIMNVVLDEAREAYAEEIVVTLQSESTDDLESNVSRILQWIEAWRKNQGLESGT
jgi:adenylate kinase